MKVWKCKQVIDFDQSTTTVKEERNKTLRWMNQITIHLVTISCTFWENLANLYVGAPLRLAPLPTGNTGSTADLCRQPLSQQTYVMSIEWTFCWNFIEQLCATLIHAHRMLNMFKHYVNNCRGGSRIPRRRICQPSNWPTHDLPNSPKKKKQLEIEKIWSGGRAGAWPL